MQRPARACGLGTNLHSFGELGMSTMSIPMSAAVVASSRDPKERARLGENRPEMRRRLIIAALKLIGARLVRSDPRDGTAALERAVDLGVITRAKLDFLRHAHAYWKADPNADSSFTSVETEDGEGLVPYFFTRTAAPMGAPIYRKLAWHATDALTPIFSDLPDVLADDAAAVATGVRLLGVHRGSGGSWRARCGGPGRADGFA